MVDIQLKIKALLHQRHCVITELLPKDVVPSCEYQLNMELVGTETHQLGNNI